MASFDEMLKQLHSNKGTILTDAEANEPIVINSLRQFEVPKEYNLTIAYEGDVNSQIITFKIPRMHEGHDLSECGLKTIRWKNHTSNIEDCSNLEVINDSKTLNDFLVKWIVPPAAFSAAGTLEISISLYDLVGTLNQIAFSWNTPIYSGFSVGKSSSGVGKGPSIPSIIAPAKNEVLFINEETRSIVAPQGYNFNVTTFGNKNTDALYFQVSQKIGELELTNEDVEAFIIVVMDGYTDEFPIQNRFASFADGSLGTGLMNFMWKIPEEISNNVWEYTGPFSIAISFRKTEQETVGDTTKTVETRWTTLPFNNLTIKPSLVYNSSEVLPANFTTILNGQSAELNLTGVRDIPGIVRFRSLADETEILQNELILRGDKIFFGLADGKPVPFQELVIDKSQTAEEWESNKNYIPKKGELILYKPNGIKIGNGSNLASQLPFVNGLINSKDGQPFTMFVGTREEYKSSPVADFAYFTDDSSVDRLKRKYLDDPDFKQCLNSGIYNGSLSSNSVTANGLPSGKGKYILEVVRLGSQDNFDTDSGNFLQQKLTFYEANGNNSAFDSYQRFGYQDGSNWKFKAWSIPITKQDDLFKSHTISDYDDLLSLINKYNGPTLSVYFDVAVALGDAKWEDGSSMQLLAGSLGTLTIHNSTVVMHLANDNFSYVVRGRNEKAQGKFVWKATYSNLNK